MYLRVVYLRQLHGVAARIRLGRINVTDAFRRVPVDPASATPFGYVGDDHIVD